MRRATLICTVIISLLPSGVAPSNAVTTFGAAEAFEEANRLYQEMKFEQAAQHYQEILAAEGANGAVFFNLGNCFYRLNRTGKAVLYYLRAEKLLPDDPEVRVNLELARARRIDEIPVPAKSIYADFAERAITFFGTAGFTALLLLFFYLAGLGGLLYFRGRRGSRLAGIYLLIAGLLGTSISASGLYFADRRIHDFGQAVVMVSRCDARSGPGVEFKSQFVIHEGMEVQIRDEQSDFYLIALPNGLGGWTAKSEIARVRVETKKKATE